MLGVVAPCIVDAAEDPFTGIVQPAFAENCIQCHGENGKVKGKVNLLELADAASLMEDPELLEDLIDALDFEEMPPEDEPPLEVETRTQLIAQLEEWLQLAVSSQASYRQAPVRRMNRFQYNNAVSDLFDLNCVVFPLPERMMREHGTYFEPASGKMPDTLKVGSRPLGKSQLIEKRLAGVAPFPQDLRAEHGFDNRGDHLSLSPLLLESFFKLSRSIVESEDFDAGTCGIWDSFFGDPGAGDELEQAVRARLEPFLSRAFRRHVDEAQLERYVSYVLTEIESGETFTTAMKSAASAVLASPRFLYLYDRPGSDADAEGGVEPVDDYDLASRLSFFLWGSVPDDTLLDLAAEGRLRDAEIYSEQVERMLDDLRLKRFCDSFPAQWLQLDRIISSAPDREQFPDFFLGGKFLASMHMGLEPLLLFETVLVEDRSILDLIDPDFSYRSDLLDRAYGNEQAGTKRAVASIPFQRVALDDRRQGGVITNAAVMTMTSSAERTQPITRGAWLATVIFNDPPKPPPADVPPLSEKPGADEQHLTLRERLVDHREREDCAGCHEKIDPLGFALENYGPTGQWRDDYENGREVDMSGRLFRKHEFADIIEFKDAILAEKDRFTRALGAHLLSFALARELNPADSAALDRIAAQTAADDYRMQTLLREVMLSEPFLHRSIPVPAVEN